MRDPTAEFFAELGDRRYVPLLDNIVGSVRFDLTQDGHTEHWHVTIRNGNVRIVREYRLADCVARLDKMLFDAVVGGAASMMVQMLRGAVVVSGEAELFVQFQRLFPAHADVGGRQPMEATGGVS